MIRRGSKACQISAKAPGLGPVSRREQRSAETFGVTRHDRMAAGVLEVLSSTIGPAMETLSKPAHSKWDCEYHVVFPRASGILLKSPLQLSIPFSLSSPTGAKSVTCHRSKPRFTESLAGRNFQGGIFSCQPAPVSVYSNQISLHRLNTEFRLGVSVDERLARWLIESASDVPRCGMGLVRPTGTGPNARTRIVRPIAQDSGQN
jgi:hypothetical protein